MPVRCPLPGRSGFVPGQLFFALAACALALALFAGTAHASLTGDLEGTVRDPTGAVIVGAGVSIRHLATGTTRTLTTDSYGQFAALQLDLGGYEVRVRKDGFQSLVEVTQVRSGEKTRLQLDLKIGPVEQVVQVPGNFTPLLDVATSQVSQSLDPRSVTALPLLNRDTLQFATLSPGTVPVSKDNPFLTVGCFNANGSRGRANNITVDGSTATDIVTTGDTAGRFLSPEAVQEFKLITSNPSAEFGRNSGAQLQLITKSGGNDFHGSAYWFHQNSVFNARDYFDQTGDPTRLIRNQWGGTLGGPILKNRLFFFANYEGLKIRGAANTTTAYVLTPAEAAAITDPTSQSLFQAMGAPTSPTGQLSSVAPNITDQYLWSVRIDANLRPNKDLLTARYGQNPATQVFPAITFLTSGLPNFGGAMIYDSRAFALTETHIFNPRVVNQFRFAYGRDDPAFPVYSTLSQPYAPIIAIDGYDALGVSGLLPQARVQNVFQWSDSLSYSRGRHSFKFGGDVVYYQAYSYLDSNFRGTVVFPDLASFQTGDPSNFSQSFGDSHRHFVSKDFFAYAQDDFRLTPALTFNLGLRVERSGGISEKNGILSNLDTASQAPLGGAGTGPLGSLELGGPGFGSNLNWAPRLGFAWNPGRGKWVVRAGYGITYDFIFYSLMTQLRFTPPFFVRMNINDFSGENSYAALVNGTAPAIQDARASVGSFNPTVVNLGGFQPVQQDLRNPRNQQWNFGVEYQLWRDAVLKVGYIGSHNDYLEASVLLNLANANSPAPATSEADEIARLATQFRPFARGLTGTPTTPAANRIDPRFNYVYQIQSTATSDYHSLQVEFTKQVSHGIALDASYTWSHSLDDTSDAMGVLINDDPGQQDPRNLGRNRANSQFDVRHRFVANFMWELPWGKHLQGASGKVLSGWAFSGIADVRSGMPVSIFSGTRRGIGMTTMLATGSLANGDVGLLQVGAGAPADLCSRGVVTGNSTKSCPNTSGFPITQPLLGNLGDSGRNRLRLDGFSSLDFAILKNTRLGERVTSQFRWEFYNLLNHPNMSGYDGYLPDLRFNTYATTASNMRQMQASFKVTF